MFALQCINEKYEAYLRFRNLNWSQAKSWYKWVLRNEPEQLPLVVLNVGGDWLPVIIEKAPEFSEAI